MVNSSRAESLAVAHDAHVARRVSGNYAKRSAQARPSRTRDGYDAVGHSAVSGSGTSNYSDRRRYSTHTRSYMYYANYIASMRENTSSAAILVDTCYDRNSYTRAAALDHSMDSRSAIESLPVEPTHTKKSSRRPTIKSYTADVRSHARMTKSTDKTTRKYKAAH